MKIIGRTKDLKSETTIVYAQVHPNEYLDLVGDGFEDFAIQRKREIHKAYGRLKDDIMLGASLPTITLSLKKEYVEGAISILENVNSLTEYLSKSGRCNILDGLQRTYILNDLKKEKFEFNIEQKILLEIWIESSLKKLIYRIIVLNAGQKPMSARHQIELLFSSLHTSIEEEIGGITLVKEKDQKRRRKSGSFPLQVVISGYQAFVSSATELNKDNLISQKLQVDSALDMSEDVIQKQFLDFIKYFKLYTKIDEEVFRVYSITGKVVEEENEKSNLLSPHWLTNENTCISFFASIAQYIGNKDESISAEKERRTNSALDKLIGNLSRADAGSDPLQLEALDAIRMGKNARKINVGTYTRRLLANGLKEYFRAEGDIALNEAWNLAAD